MKASSSESPRMSTRTHSVTSSRLKMTAGKSRRTGGRNVASALLQQRQAMRVLEDGVDVTPKLLVHHAFATIEEGQTTAFETIGLSRAGSSAQLAVSASGHSTLRASSSIFSRTSSLPADDAPVESLLSTQITLDTRDDLEDRAPSQFYLPSTDSGFFLVRPETVTITLRETETFMLFEMRQLTGDLQTPEGVAIQKANERYERITVGAESNRKLADAETQTIQTLTKSHGTYLARKTRRNRGTFVNNWEMHDTYARPELMKEVNGRLVVHTEESIQDMLGSQELQHKLPQAPEDPRAVTVEDQLARICKQTTFANAVLVMERIIASNVFIGVHKRFKGLVKQDPCSLDLEFTYSPDLLWTHACKQSQGREVSSFRWSGANSNVLAVAYGARANSDTKDGLVLVWCVKNPSRPGRVFAFNSPVSDIDWSRDRPNLLAVGLYDGAIRVIDASSEELNVIRRSRRATSPASSPHWQVQWWASDEQFDYEEQIYTCDQDGRVYRYRSGEDFTSGEIMRITRVEGEIAGVQRVDRCTVQGVPISRHPGALVLRRHPSSATIYLVGSDEGCLYRCSTNYLHQHVESFLAHDGPVYSVEFSPFCPRIFLTCGADWCARIWADGLAEPLVTLSTTMACVRCAAWSPAYSTVVASVANNEICIWDIKRKTYAPVSVTTSPNDARLVAVRFTANGEQLVTADVDGVVYVYNLEGMPFPPYNQKQVLVESIERALVTKPELLRKLWKTGPPF